MNRAIKVFGVFCVITVIFRFALQFLAIDHSTGFYALSSIGKIGQITYSLLLLVGAGAIWSFSKQTQRSIATAQISMMGSVFIAFMSMGLVMVLTHLFSFYVEVSDLLAGYAPYVAGMLPTITGILGGAVFMYMGFMGIVGKQNRIGLFASVIASLWAAATLLFTYMDYPIVFSISDNMLHVVTMAALTLLLVSLMKAHNGINTAASNKRSLTYAMLTLYFGLNLLLPYTAVLMTGYGDSDVSIFESLGMLAMGYNTNSYLPMPNLLDLTFVLTVCALSFFVIRGMLSAADSLATQGDSEDAPTVDQTVDENSRDGAEPVS